MQAVAKIANIGLLLLFMTVRRAGEGKSLGNGRENKINPNKFDTLGWVIHGFKKQPKVIFHAFCPAHKQEVIASHFSKPLSQ